MKKPASLLLGLVLIIALVACGENPQKSIVEESPSTIGSDASVPQSSSEIEVSDVSTQESSVSTNTEESKPSQEEAPTIPNHTHNYERSSIAPTCKTQGYAVYTCSCGHTYTADYVSALSHSYTKSVTPATCTAQGYTTHTCSSCGSSYKDDYTSASHKYSSSTTAATCNSQGYTTYTCSICGDSYKDNYTSGSHNYVNYKCSSCGMVDTNHAYEFFMEWIKENGTANGSIVEITYYTDTHKMILDYDAQYNNISVQAVGRGDTFSFSSIHLDTFFYGASIDEDLEIIGYLTPGNFNDNSAISYDSYTGSPSLKWDMIEFARVSCCMMVDFLDWYLKEYNVGITIADLGFTSWVSQY